MRNIFRHNRQAIAVVLGVSVLAAGSLSLGHVSANTLNSADTSIAASQQATAEMMANTCAGCHGTQGIISNSAFMPLAGMPENTFIKTMLDFRNDERPSTLMGHVAKGFTEEEIRLMATFFADIKSEKQP